MCLVRLCLGIRDRTNITETNDALNTSTAYLANPPMLPVESMIVSMSTAPRTIVVFIMVVNVARPF